MEGLCSKSNHSLTNDGEDCNKPPLNGDVAQLGERRVRNAEARGSNPLISTKKIKGLRSQSVTPVSFYGHRTRINHMLRPILLLFLSNLFMTFAWYGHLKNMSGKPLILVVLVSWGIAFFEYILQVPANRIGIQYFNLGQLKVLQEVITMSVFAGFAFFYMKQPLKLDYLWAALCLLGAAYFMFRNTGPV